MGHGCCNDTIDCSNGRFKRILIISLVLNFTMFVIEVIFGVISGSVSLKADALDFLGDSANYAASLYVVNSELNIKAKVSIVKAITMLGFGIWIIADGLIKFFADTLPDSFTMGWVGSAALVVNLSVALLLYRFRDGDSNRESVWLCSRNDAIGNVLVVLASFGVTYFHSKVPDLAVAFTMSTLSIMSSIKVFTKARIELTTRLT